MKVSLVTGLCLAAALWSIAPPLSIAQAGVPTLQSYVPNPPTTWIDKSTGHRVTRLTNEPYSTASYFNENVFTPDGKEMIYMAGPQSLYVLDMVTHLTRKLLDGHVIDFMVGRKTPVIYFMRPDDLGLYAVGVRNGQVVKITDLPANAAISSLNADETLIAGTYTEGPTFASIHKTDPNLRPTALKATAMDDRLAAHLPMVLFTVDLQTAKIRNVLHTTDWLNHVQFSPKDPQLLMYCHEGLWYKVDRIWTILADGTHNQLVHTRTMNNEIAGHEFWDADGKTIWYDLQVPRGSNFYLASFNTDTKARTWYSVERDAWSIHYNVSSDDKIFCGDGGDYAQVAKSRNGQWIELLTPRASPVPLEIDQTNLIQSGFFVTEHLVNMTYQNYAQEPNVRFSPDHQLVIFNSNMFGPTYVFAVEVAKAKIPPTP